MICLLVVLHDQQGAFVRNTPVRLFLKRHCGPALIPDILLSLPGICFFCSFSLSSLFESWLKCATQIDVKRSITAFFAIFLPVSNVPKIHPSQAKSIIIVIAAPAIALHIPVWIFFCSSDSFDIMKIISKSQTDKYWQKEIRYC